MKHKRNDPMCGPRDSQGDEKNAFSISVTFCLDSLIRNENLTSEECKTKNRYAKQKTVKNNIASRASYKPSKLEG